METLLLGLVLLWSLYTAFAKLAPRSFAALAERMARWCGVDRPLSSDGRAGRQPNACDTDCHREAETAKAHRG